VAAAGSPLSPASSHWLTSTPPTAAIAAPAGHQSGLDRDAHFCTAHQRPARKLGLHADLHRLAQFAARGHHQPDRARTPGNQRAVVGGIDFLRTTFFNRASQFVNGYDLDATYRLPRTALGNFTVNTTWSYLNDFHSYTSTSAPRTDLLGTNSAAVAGATPKWRSNSTVTWRNRGWTAFLGR
jgi:hypothetical protein